jgi:hypothetical protein
LSDEGLLEELEQHKIDATQELALRGQSKKEAVKGKASKKKRY